jgi:Vesicle coat protein involved in Golgi to plasma membrane transport
MHGPKSVLCTQVLPLECAQCLPPPPLMRSSSSSSSSSTSLATQIHEASHHGQFSRSPSLHQTETGLSLPTNFSAASTNVDSAPESPTIERHELFVANNKLTDQERRFKFSGAGGDTCASCSLVVPDHITRNLPDGAPGSLRADGKTKNGAPVLRSREMVCLGSGDHSAPNEDPRLSSSQNSSDGSDGASSLRSCGSLFSNCHDHLLTYLTSRNPDDPENFSALRASVIRTLSREQLPAGMSDGPFCFGDSTNGYTIAYVFRLPDPKARGRRRLYAFVALAGNDATRAFRACPFVWDAFAKMAKSIEAAAVESQEEQKRKDEEEQDTGKARNYTPVSSFLAQRAVDPDGHPRKAGQIAARSLADIVGNDRIFSEIHSYFVSLLHHLGALYGGLPLTETNPVCQTTVQEDGLHPRARPQSVHTEILKAKDIDKLRDQDATPRPKSMDAAGTKSASGNQSAAQCAPIALDKPTQQQVVV